MSKPYGVFIIYAGSTSETVSFNNIWNVLCISKNYFMFIRHAKNENGTEITSWFPCQGYSKCLFILVLYTVFPARVHLSGFGTSPGDIPAKT